MTGVYLVLAAGRGSRMGKAKALVEVHGESLLSHHVHAAQLARLGGPICVTGTDGDAIEAAHDAYPIRFVRNDAPDAPMMDSVRIGLGAVAKENAVFLIPVDVLPPRLDTFDLLAEALEQLSTTRIGIRPVMRGRGGHPLVLLPDAVREILQDPAIDRLDAWVRAAVDAERILDVEVDDYNVLTNINTPGDVPGA